MLLAICLGAAATDCLAHDENKRLGHYLAISTLTLILIVSISAVILAVNQLI